jgi:tight adherence protein C
MALSIPAISVLGGLVAAVGAFLAVLAFRPPARSQADLVVERLDLYQAVQPEPVDLDEEEARLRFDERVLAPMLRWLATRLARSTPEAARIDLQRNLNLVGRPLGLSAGEFLAVRYVVAALGALAGGVVGVALGRPALIPVSAVMGGALGLLAPRILLGTRVKKARTEMRITLPDSMDLMSVCVEAGLTFEGAMARVSERFQNTLGAEFGQVLREIRLGRARRDAMAELGERSGVYEVSSFAQAVIQSDELGTGIARILRIQSDELRMRRRQRAQELGAKAGLKMLFPMVIFIFPSLWIVLLGPAVLLILHQFGSL